ncbi:MAG: hypothetical protein SPI51_05955 [Candidatus Enterosoma sp.]|nr:hypothetical protein [bacterium]MDY4549737.1 hypothetical protein [Candidatus Enterosoma sp.]MDD7617529.1 hypothetical protein [bacterium]MDY5910144.1 hypothetical protein [Candidatus Enterosoma sp.]MDY5970638.1 hypothetical protein [Candidatus Enterosoma sp.]
MNRIKKIIQILFSCFLLLFQTEFHCTLSFPADGQASLAIPSS